MIQFEVGKSYALHLPAKYDGKATFITDIYTVTKRTPCYLTFSHISHDGTKMPHCRCKIFTSDSRGEFVHATAFFCLYADSHIDDDSQPELSATADDAISANDNDTALASQPAIVATAESDLPAKILNADNKSAFDTRLALLEKLPLSVLTDFAHNELIDTAGISAEKMPAYVRLILNERLSNIARGLEVTDNGIAIQTPLLSLYRESRGFLPANIRFRVATQYYGTDKNGVKHVVSIDKRQPDTISAGLVYDGNSHKVYGTAFDFAVRVRNGVEEITYFKFGCPGATEDLEFTVSANAVEPDYDDPDYPGYKPAIQSEIRYEPLYKRDFGISSRITAHAEISQPEALYMDDSYSDAPGDNSCPDMDIPDDHNPLHIVQTWYGGNHSDAEICRLKRNYEAPHYKGYSIFAQFIPSVPVRFCLAKSESQALALAREYCNAFCLPCKCTDARVEKLCDYFPDWTDFLPRYMDDSLSARVFRDFHYDPLHFFRDKGIHERKNDNPPDNPGFTVVPSEHITHQDCTVYPEPIIDECPYVSVPACDIPENHNSAAAVVPHVNPITAATMRLASNLAALLFVVCKIIIPLMFMRKKDLKKANTDTFLFTVGYKYVALFHDKRQFITISDRHTDKYGFTWLSFYDEDNISYNARVKLRDDGYTELLDFKELERTCYAFEGFKPIKESNRVKYIKFEVGRSYTAKRDSFGEHREFHITVLERFSAVSCNNVKSKNKIICLKVCATDSNEQNKSVTGWIHAYVNRDIHAEEFTRLPNLILRADQPDSVQTVPAEINDITPQPKTQPKTLKHNPAPASDIEHKLIETKDLHFSERRKALDHNAAVISSCMFSEAVISLLSSISLQAILLLGFHMRLFIAKPKGKKNVIAGLFAKRLIECRELHANVRSNPANINAKYSASVPDGVKFFETKHRQLGFIFTE